MTCRRSTSRAGRCRAAVTVGLVAVVSASLTTAGPAVARDRTTQGEAPPRSPVAVGSGGAVASVDPYATQIGLQVLADGGNAADAAVATAAALGVTEPYSSGIGGGGFLVYYDAASGTVSAVDGREAAPETFTPTVFTDGQGNALDFWDVVSSGLSVGVPGTPALWDTALDRFGTWSLEETLEPAERLARRGFVVDETFAQQTADNAERFRQFPATVETYLPGGQVPEVGSVFTNRDLARAYHELGVRGVDALYSGRIADAIVSTARDPETVEGVDVYAGQITEDDLEAYDTQVLEPTESEYRGLTVYGMPVPSSGGITVGESLNLLESYDALTGRSLATVPEGQYLHRFAEATSTAFADRNRYIGSVSADGDVDNTGSGVPEEELLSQAFADERACGLFDPDVAHPRPIPFGTPDGSYSCTESEATTEPTRDDHGTTHLVAADRWGNVASYTLTIEQTGGSGITVPGYGFLLNNELTDFNFTPVTEGVPDPNLPGPGKRPRSSMSPTIVTDGEAPVLALGSPGGATIITTVAQVLTEHLDRGLPLVDAIAAPRLSSRNGTTSNAEPAIIGSRLGARLEAKGHDLSESAEIGAATAIRVLPGGAFEAAAETERRGGGAAGVVVPDED